MDRPSSWWSSLLSAHSCKARWPCEAFFLTFFGLEAAGSGRPRRPINPAFPRNNRFGLAGFSLIRRLNSGYEMSHFRLEFDIVQRSRGGSALHMSAYQARGQFAAPGGQIKDYSSRGDHIATLMFAPAGAPDWINDPQEAWRRATFAEKRWDAQEARIVQLSLPRGLSRGSWEDIARRISAPF